MHPPLLNLRVSPDVVVSMAGGHQHSENGGRHRTYFEERNRKLAEQAEVTASSSTDGKKMFKGVRVYIDGFMAGTTDIEMKRIVTLAGGQVMCVLFLCQRSSALS